MSAFWLANSRIDCHRPQSSSASRFTAGAVGFLLLIPVRRAPRAVMPTRLILQACANTSGPSSSSRCSLKRSPGNDTKDFCNKICHLRTDAPQRRFKTTTPSNPENLRVACLNLLAHLFHRHGILLHDLDLAEWLAAGLLLGLQVLRTHAAMIDDELLRFRGEAE